MTGARDRNRPGRLPRLFLFDTIWMHRRADIVAPLVATFEEKSVSDRERKFLKVIRFLLEKVRCRKEKRKKPSVLLDFSFGGELGI